MDLLDLLRRQAGRFQCPNCGQSMADCRLDLVAGGDVESLVKVTCAHCEDTRMIAVALDRQVSGEPAVSVRDEPLSPAPSVSTDEVLDVRLLMRQHQGDLASLLTPPAERL